MGNQLSFSLTESELARQKFGEDNHTRLDPRGKGDKIMLVIFTTIYSFDLVAVIYMLWNRKYPPLKAKNVPVITLVMMFSFVWFVGDLQANGHLPLANTPLTNCKAFGMWMRVILGVCGVFSLIGLRSYGLYRVFFLYKPYHSLGLYLPFAIYWVCVLIAGTISQTIRPDITTQYVSNLDICQYHKSFQTTLYAFLWVTVALVMFIHWKIRNIKSSFNESREATITSIIVAFVVTFATVMRYVLPKYPLDIRLRITNTALNHITTNAVWWLIMGVPLYNCLFNRQKYLNHWILKLREDGLQKEYNVASNVVVGSQGMSDSFNVRSTLLASTAGNKEGGAFYAMDDSIYNNKDNGIGHNTQTTFERSPDSPIYANGEVAYQQSIISSTTTGQCREGFALESVADSSSINYAHNDNPLPRAQTSLIKPRPQSQNVGQWAGPNVDSDLYHAPQATSKLYTLITIPEAAAKIPFRPGTSQDVSMNYQGSDNRHLL
ncbi:hypothetical protein BX661DRAFT_196139 [Kickxella alabastrina]|uniref:uncharacterized protein n=1 Tax=Kickxella alabastrina TaxID=61397 RepID=UPI002220CE12|nr:uncharacterized protein BX661DRAFT_196139 [Kickxella alabastrina]KAI7833610.1 hypothetical protein BX661DRAFT_196139 [Kickxella alabastrina]